VRRCDQHNVDSCHGRLPGAGVCGGHEEHQRVPGGRHQVRRRALGACVHPSCCPPSPPPTPHTPACAAAGWRTRACSLPQLLSPCAPLCVVSCRRVCVDVRSQADFRMHDSLNNLRITWQFFEKDFLAQDATKTPRDFHKFDEKYFDHFNLRVSSVGRGFRSQAPVIVCRTLAWRVFVSILHCILHVCVGGGGGGGGGNDRRLGPPWSRGTAWVDSSTSFLRRTHDRRWCC
jgi:hypothetical protein